MYAANVIRKCACVQMCLCPCIILTTSLCIFQEKYFGLDVCYLIYYQFHINTDTVFLFVWGKIWNYKKKDLVKYIFWDMDEILSKPCCLNYACNVNLVRSDVGVNRQWIQTNGVSFLFFNGFLLMCVFSGK